MSARFPRVLVTRLPIALCVTASLTAAEPGGSRNPVADIPLSKLSATRERPLFSPSRRPPAPPKAVATSEPEAADATPAAPAPEAFEPPFKLVGTVVGGEDRIAVLLDPAANQARRARQGEIVGGWSIRSIDPRSAVLEDGLGHRVTLALPRGPTGDGPAPAVSEAPTKPPLAAPVSQ